MLNQLILKINQKAELFAQVSLVVLFFAFPISRALFNTALAFMVIGALFSGRFLEKYKCLRLNPITVPILLILLIMLVSTTYTSASSNDLLMHFFVYIKLIYVLCAISIINNQKLIKYCLFAFSAAMFITLVSTFLNIWLEIPWSKSNAQGLGQNHSVFRDYIVQGLTMSFFTLLLISYSVAIKNKYLKLFLIFTALMAVFSIIHLNAGRTGYLALFFGLGFYIFYILSPKLKWYGFLAVFIIISIIFYSSSIAQLRVIQVLQDIQAFKENPFTSSGARLYMWGAAIQLYWDAPWFGHGTASYHELAKAAFNNKAMCDIACFHPHNQFLFFAVEHGILGVAVLCFYIYKPYKFALTLATELKALLIGFLAIFVVDCMTHGPLWLRMESYFFVYMMGLLMAFANLNSNQRKLTL